MALHGPIKVNEVTIGYWGATRISTGDDGMAEYDCDVEQYGGKRRMFRLEHRIDDGALVLAAKVLMQAVSDA